MTNEKRKGNSVVTVAYTDDGKMQIHVLGYKTLTFDKTKASEANRLHAEDHGWEQRLRDAAAVGRDEETGQPATPAYKGARVERLIEHYESGAEEWTLVGGGGGRSLTIEAIARVKGMTYEEAEAEVAKFAAKPEYAGDTKAALAFLRKGKRVMDAMAEIRKEREGAPKIDADAALDEMAQ